MVLKFAFLTCLLLVPYIAICQIKASSHVLFRATTPENPLEWTSAKAWVEYVPSTGFFRFDVDLTTLVNNNYALDSSFLLMNNSLLLFEGRTQQNAPYFASDMKPSDETFPLEGTLILNGVEKSITLRYAFLDPYRSNSQPRVSFFFDFIPAEFNLRSLAGVKKIEVIVKEGFLNKL